MLLNIVHMYSDRLQSCVSYDNGQIDDQHFTAMKVLCAVPFLVSSAKLKGACWGSISTICINLPIGEKLFGFEAKPVVSKKCDEMEGLLCSYSLFFLFY